MASQMETFEGQISERDSRIRQLISDNQILRSQLLLGEKREKVKDEEYEKLKDKLNDLNKRFLHRQKELSDKIEQLNNEVKNVREQYLLMKEELSDTRDEIRRYENLQRNVCNNSCAVDSLYWIYKNKLSTVSIHCACGPDGCKRMLEKIIIDSAGEKIHEKHLDCDKFIIMLSKCGVVTLEEQYPYCNSLLYGTVDRQEQINKAWTKLMTMNKDRRVLMLGRKYMSKQTGRDRVGGHMIVCDLEGRSEDESEITMYDPQNSLTSIPVNEKTFKNESQKDIVLMTFTVNFDKLKDIIVDYNCKVSKKETQYRELSGAMNSLDIQ